MPGQKVFISYAQEDADQVKRIVDCLRVTHHLQVWNYREGRTTARPIGDAIREAIHDADHVLFVITRNSITSSWVEEESKIAACAPRPRSAVVLDDCSYKGTVLWNRVNDLGGWEERHPMSEDELETFCRTFCDGLDRLPPYASDERRPELARVKTYSICSRTPDQICVSLVPDTPGYEARRLQVAALFGNPNRDRWPLTPQQFNYFLRLVGDNSAPRHEGEG